MLQRKANKDPRSTHCGGAGHLNKTVGANLCSLGDGSQQSLEKGGVGEPGWEEPSWEEGEGC